MFEALAGLTGIGLFALKIRRDNKRYLEAEMRRIENVSEEELEKIRARIQAQKDRYRAEQQGSVAGGGLRNSEEVVDA
jgi:hypothetical protein